MTCPKCYDRLFDTIFTQDGRKKIEQLIGNIAIGNPKGVPKYTILYGGPGTGKSTFRYILTFGLFPDLFNFRIYPTLEITGDYIFIDDCPDSNEVITLSESDDRFKDSLIIMTTNKLPKLPNSDVQVIPMAGDIVSYDEYRKLMIMTYYLAEPYRWYCIDNLEI